VIEPARTIRRPQLLLARSKGGRSIRSVEASAVRFDGCLPAAILSTIFGARNTNRINLLT
jgi:hypothetical protein